MINVSEIIDDPDFAQAFKVQRSSGTWVLGRFIAATETLQFSGVIEPLNTKEIKMLPEGDQITGGINIWTRETLHTTKRENALGGKLSDEVIWQGENWKVYQVQNFSDFGYQQAICVRKLGA